jgi:hypothetical protein
MRHDTIKAGDLCCSSCGGFAHASGAVSVSLGPTLRRRCEHTESCQSTVRDAPTEVIGPCIYNALLIIVKLSDPVRIIGQIIFGFDYSEGKYG